MNDKQISCAVGIIQNPENEVLIAKRPLHKPLSGFWEFPGGKIEANESAIEALVRELYEELGIQCNPAAVKELLNYHFDYPAYRVLLKFFLINEFIGIPKGLEGQFIQWVKIADLREYPMLEGNIQIIEMLEKSESLFIA